MATQPDRQPMTSDPQTNSAEGGGGIGPGTLATMGLGLIALAILIWFLYPRFSGSGQPATAQPPGTLIARMVTTTPLPLSSPTPAPAKVLTKAPTPVPASPSPTPIPPTATLPARVQAGVYARVASTGVFGLRFRSGPGQDFVTWRILPEGEILKITGGPEEADGVIWWRALDKTGLVGWAAEQYLVPVEPPVWTPEPERTPDLTEIASTPES